jgi:cytochrome d ubiquinol oxidase subunit I
MQHPVGYSLASDGSFGLQSFWGLVLNHWALWQYSHTMLGAVQTGCFVMAAIGAYYLLSNVHVEEGKLFVRTAVIVGVIAACMQLSPTGDKQGLMISRYQKPTLAAMEGLFETQDGAPLAILGQPDVKNQRLDNPLIVPDALSFLTYRAWSAKVDGLDRFPRSDWPDNIELLYFSYHIMVGLGTLFIAILVIAAWKLFRGTLYGSKIMLWTLMLALPFPFIANTAGWITAEVGRQPWLIYGLMRTSAGVSPLVSAGSAWFTLLGFFGMYMVLGILFLYLVYREIDRGPAPGGAEAALAA